MSPRAYGILHRIHHAYADTDKDPHSPKHFSNVFAMMWQTKIAYGEIMDNKVKSEERFTKNLPDWPRMDKWAQSYANRIMFGALYFGFYLLFAPYWWLFALVPVHILMGPIHGSIINWFAHKYGKVSFKVNNTSRNFVPIDVFMLGENYHNNHHKYPSKANFGIKWYEIDPIYFLMRTFELFGIIRIRNKSRLIESEY